MRVFLEDGRSFLESRPNTERYDFIFLDAFVGIGFVPLRLSTQEFFRLCKNQLSLTGTLVVNVLPKGGLVLERLATLSEESDQEIAKQVTTIETQLTGT